MARYTGSKHKLCRREGIKLCDSPKCPIERKGVIPPGQHGLSVRRRKSNFGIQLREKQKVKAMYGILERQFRRYFKTALQATGNTGEKLFQILESRLDNVVYRLGLVSSRRFARQLVNHGLVKVNDKKVDIPSYEVGAGDVIAFKDRALKIEGVQKSLKEKAKTPSWLTRQGPVGKVERLPGRDDVQEDIQEQLIIEFYSR
ncbi:30S ribosomal protein S4 [candidate division WWE3 bacterium CG06_land_8_20_14_3_00_42_16]|uniref:Small ribosomal subunit protein uS4 n=4 Tax=Katanobacteria TaxID=422282 RepID=A0A2M7AMS1_UNCKA|nr:MAG: 30S ribosomal protein S4 [bacterium CG1_02_42_9]PIU68664.1 MAG: 30S ribosomal protein S4 [candidate division WWE3 bacterium CG06_land_8_20_14_3_00_42_16]PIZ43028.1 MAG: 30S ribosomal protein S4 [candidate division WWE3 bacterium CG_4_10_14_0_2_um_filter_42_8]PJA38365.1 MAG: 30S ribosomal protein S4 [candidate division WWE3 bacterium CG_4_9_14_3_um_filter_43_9]PJC69028.1 MAG: 30S ribosomal protein S4 [candidate division WWE3 bacterium CG_4_8_14_3_um_filter_42_11]